MRRPRPLGPSPPPWTGHQIFHLVSDGGLAHGRPWPQVASSGLQDSGQPSAECWRVVSLQVRSGTSSSQCAPVGPSGAWWNDNENDMPSPIARLLPPSAVLIPTHPGPPLGVAGDREPSGWVSVAGW